MDTQFRDEVFVVTFALENAAVSRSLIPSSGIVGSVMAVEISSAGYLFAQVWIASQFCAGVRPRQVVNEFVVGNVYKRCWLD